jgi:hypothetical protein
MDFGSIFPSVSAPNPYSGLSGLFDSYNKSQQASRDANAALANQTLNYWGGVMSQNRADQNQAFNYLRGTNKANIRDIDKRFSALSGQTASGLIDRGLGNSTIQYSMQKGITNAHADALSRSRADFGNLMFNAQMDMARNNAGLASQQLNYLSGINIGYPDFGAYAQMAGMMGHPGMMGGGGGGTYIGDMSRPVGGPQPAWTKYGGVSTDMGVGGGDYGFSGYATGIPTTGQAAMASRAAMGGGGDSGGGFWASLYPGFEAQRNYANSPLGMTMGAAGAVAQGAQGDPWAGVGYPVQNVGDIPSAYQ